ncbi:MAG TPA: DNA polymerase/3'-5' exonuclease PolX [Bryobacteraceae bacterium]|nr:DNA polymerase/3'-5' exonuclease PolX [Bryobacteraceae bacterium]
MENRDLARILYETGDLLEIAGEDSFRIRSYRNGAAAIEGHAERVSDILADPERKVTDIPGIGKGLAAVLKEINTTGSFDKRDELLAKFPACALDFLKIPGLGPKSIALLFEHFRVQTMDELEQLCVDQKLRDLPRMGAKLEDKVLRGIRAFRERSGRFLLSFADNTAQELSAWLGELPGLDSITPAGSLRRGKETIGDLDLLVTGSNAAAALERVATHPKVYEVLVRGVNKTSVKFGRDGLQVDVRALEHGTFGAAMQYFTGSKEHNVALRQRAVRMGYKLSEYGLFRMTDDSRVAGDTEEGVYGALGLDWIPPELRENLGEIELAQEHALPKLVEQPDIRGDIHMHTTATDGRATLEEMAEAARKLGYEYIAITDHSKAIAMAFGLDEKRVVEFAQTVRRINETGNLGIRIFSGLECDIMKEGEMDIAWDALAELDIVIGSVHNNMNLEPGAMTDRLLRALECPHLTALGHPTGRLLLHRDPYDFDFDRVIAEAIRRGVWLEINSSPERLDLSANHVRTAKAKGAKFIVSTDAHHPRHLLNMRYGIATARRAGLEARDVTNTLPADRFAEALRHPLAKS